MEPPLRAVADDSAGAAELPASFGPARTTFLSEPLGIVRHASTCTATGAPANETATFESRWALHELIGRGEVCMCVLRSQVPGLLTYAHASVTHMKCVLPRLLWCSFLKFLERSNGDR